MTKLPLVTDSMHEDVLLSDEFTSGGKSDDDGEEIDDKENDMESSQEKELVCTLS